MKKWSIAYTRFRETENGGMVFSRPIVTDEDELDPRSPHHAKLFDLVITEGRVLAGKPLPKRNIECWLYRKSFNTKEEADAALCGFPIEEHSLASGTRAILWVYADGRRKWSPSYRPDDWTLAFDYAYRQCEWENEYGKYHSPPRLPIQEF